MNPRSKLILVLFIAVNFSIHAQKGEESVRAVFYNCENYFDSFNDSLTNDDEFTPFGDRYWTYSKFEKKRNNIFKVLAATLQWEKPGLVGLCEIENRFVLNQLLYETPLHKYPFGMVHRESPDTRGIDVALFYNTDVFTLIKKQFIEVTAGSGRPTRDILFASLRTNKSDTLHVFVNHWPSKYGGVLETRESRMQAAIALKSKTDSLFKADSAANILIMGDFNDSPSSEAIVVGLGARAEFNESENVSLFNLAVAKEKNGEGSHKYQGEWSMIDQIIVSSKLLENVIGNEMQIFRSPFLLESDEKHLGEKPFRTFVGYKYHGGFSDHLPVYIDLRFRP